MKTKIKNKSKILEAVYETMNDFHASGIIDDEKMQQYKKMCLEPEPIKLDQDILDYLNQKCNFDSEKMSALMIGCAKILKLHGRLHEIPNLLRSNKLNM